MLRLLGFIVGAMLTALVLFDLDPHAVLHRGEALVAEAQEWLHASMEAPLPEAPTAEPTAKSPAVEVAAESSPEAAPAPIEEPPEEGARKPEDSAPHNAVDGSEDLQHTEPAPVVTQTPTGGWQPLWRPFRSEVSARGFAGQIEAITGRETRVRRLGPRSHQVDVAFDDETERLDTLQRLELLTGIELREEGS